MTWQQHAACKGLTHLFFPRNGVANRALKLCARCPVIEQCRQEAADLHSRGDLHGIWAGLTRPERDELYGLHASAWWPANE